MKRENKDLITALVIIVCLIIIAFNDFRQLESIEQIRINTFQEIILEGQNNNALNFMYNCVEENQVPSYEFLEDYNLHYFNCDTIINGSMIQSKGVGFSRVIFNKEEG